MSEAVLLTKIEGLELQMGESKAELIRVWQTLDTINKTLARMEEAQKHIQVPGTTTHCKMQDSRLTALENKVDDLTVKLSWYAGAATIIGAVLSLVANKFFGK